MANHKTVIEVTKITGKCPVYKVGDKAVIENSALNVKETDALCLKAIGNANYWLVYDAGDEDDIKAGTVEGFDEYKCPELGEPYTPYGPVFFRMYSIPKDE